MLSFVFFYWFVYFFYLCQLNCRRLTLHLNSNFLVFILILLPLIFTISQGINEWTFVLSRQTKTRRLLNLWNPTLNVCFRNLAFESFGKKLFSNRDSYMKPDHIMSQLYLIYCRASYVQNLYKQMYLCFLSFGITQEA